MVTSRGQADWVETQASCHSEITALVAEEAKSVWFLWQHQDYILVLTEA